MPRISYVVARLERSVRREIGSCVRRYGLTTTQYTALSVISSRTGLSNAQLARRSYLTPQAMTQVISDLKTKGLVTSGVKVTKKGTEVLSSCDAAVETMEERMLADLGPGERRQLKSLLTMCVHNLGAGL